MTFRMLSKTTKGHQYNLLVVLSKDDVDPRLDEEHIQSDCQVIGESNGK
jgi:hypothetical protein